MSRTTWFRRRPERQRPKTRLQLEQLETRSLLSSGLTLTPLSDVSPTYPPVLANPSAPPDGTVFRNSEVEPQLAVDPMDPAHAVAVWQQDRYRSVGGARAIVVSVTHDANNSSLDANNNPVGAHWSTPTAIPGFDATDPNSPFARYTDPWVTFAPNGVIYAAALGLTPAGPVPGDTAVLVSTSTDGGVTWSAPATLIHTTATSSLPINEANDKEMIVADPHDPSGKTAYVVWDQIDFPSDTADFNALHAGAADRENAFFSKTTDGGAHWTLAQNITNFLSLDAASSNQLAVEPDGTLVDVCTLFNGSGSQPPAVGQITLAVIRSNNGGADWSAPVIGPAVEAISVTDPNTGAPVRDGKWTPDITVDPKSGNLYAVWADGRFSNFTHEDIAFSMSTNDGQTWSDPIKVNQTPSNIPAGDQQAFTPTVAVNSDGTVAVTYYDFRNNTGGPGLATDYWLVYASGNKSTNPASWAGNELRLTDASFNMENAAPTSRGYFLGDYQALAAAGQSFYALFAQAGASSSNPSDIWFRDPPPAPDAPIASLSPSAAAYLAALADAGTPPDGVSSGPVAPSDGQAADEPHADEVLSNSAIDTPPAAAIPIGSSIDLTVDHLPDDSQGDLIADSLGNDDAMALVD
jgi:hypothetical protein